MSVRQAVIALGLVTGLAGCATQTQPRPSQLTLSDCDNLRTEQAATELYGPDKVTRVEPLYRTEFLARAIQPRYVAGANVYVAAEPGIGSAYLQRVLTCHAASGNSFHPNDPLRAVGISAVQVTEAGAAMRISITGKDRAAGKDIWQRAVALNEQPGDVGVEQL